ncbi:S1C family serine protease [Legionella sp.]|uniref:S1C family serine protease n=1 Tax=Legionella sp. TaxID=459 RepID=UPI00257DE67F|nr:S1C family serine protease [Legionella sp.]
MLVNSTLRLEANKQTINHAAVWSTGQTTQTSATVTVVSHKNKIYLITNAHAVVNATYLKIKFDKSSAQVPVRACWIDPVMDLAILETTNEEDKAHIESKTTALEIETDFQSKGTEVNAYGYPTGGTSLSFTKGHISRTQMSTIVLSDLTGITVQTSAPINPGNSGGPITIKDSETGVEKCIGIVTQGTASLSSVGYFIPAITVVKTIDAYRKFGKLKEAGFIDFVTVPDLSFKWQALKNPALRASLGLKDTSKELTGIYVTGVPRSSCAYDILKKGDIILRMDEHLIQADGNVEVDELENSIHFRYLIQRKEYGSKLNLVVLRKQLKIESVNEGEKELENPKECSNVSTFGEDDTELCELTLSVILNRQLGRQRLLGFKEDKPIKYHIQPAGKDGAFVFTQCTTAMIEGYTTRYNAGGTVIIDNSKRPPMFNDFETLARSKDLGEVVVLHSILTSEETDGYDNFALTSGASCVSDRVVRVNGQPIRFLADLVIALQMDPTKPAKVEFDNGKILCIAPVSDQETKNRVQTKYQIAFFTSKKLADNLIPMDQSAHTPLFEEIKRDGITLKKLPTLFKEVKVDLEEGEKGKEKENSHSFS